MKAAPLTLVKNKEHLPTLSELAGELPPNDTTLLRIRITRRCFVADGDGINRPQSAGTELVLPRWEALRIVAAGRATLTT
jgi:hypothetical protein